MRPFLEKAEEKHHPTLFAPARESTILARFPKALAMQPILLLLIYGLVCVVMSLAGGWLPLVVHLTHRRMQIAISFVSGIVLGIGLLHLLPHSFYELGSIDRTVLWAMGGFLFMFFLERFFHFHHHDAPEEELDHAHADACDHHHAHAHDEPHLSAAFSWTGVAIGLTLHGLIDGVTLAAAVQAEASEGVWVLAGIGTLLAVGLHKPFDSLTITTLMTASGKSVSARQAINAAYALVTPLGMFLFYALSHSGGQQSGVGETLGFAAGAFLCIATSDLLPELQFHRHDRTALSLALLAGIALSWSTVFLESAGHDHHHHPPAVEEHDHDHEHDHEHGHEHHHH
jgi:zinc and cadmium transporter